MPCCLVFTVKQSVYVKMARLLVISSVLLSWPDFCIEWPSFFAVIVQVFTWLSLALFFMCFRRPIYETVFMHE